MPNGATAGPARIQVTTHGGSAESATDFVVENPVPTLSELDPAQAPAGAASVSLTIHGSGFVAGATIAFGGGSVSTTFVSASELTAVVPGSLLQTAGPVSVTVTNPQPTAGDSNALTFTVQGGVSASLKVTPASASVVPGATTSLTAQVKRSDGTTLDVTSTATWTSSDAAVATVAAGTVSAHALGTATITASFEGLVSSARVEVNDGSVPPDPSIVAPAVDPTVATTLGSSTAFLYTGENPIQTGVAPGTIDARRVAIIRGLVKTTDGAPLRGVRLSVVGHPEYGSTLSRLDGAFDLAVNGGSTLVVRYEKVGLVTVQRQVTPGWQEYAWLPDVVMLPYDDVVTTVSLGAAVPQVARGSVKTDSDGTRRATLVFTPGTTATAVLAGGTSLPLASANVRATEFTVGPNGPAAMPAPLPPSSGYTYAAEFSADEAPSAEVRFSQPVINYTENFLGFPIGMAVPTGYYDRTKAAWVPSANGRVIKVLSVGGGLADLDIDGSGTPAGPAALAALGVSDAERQTIAGLYAAGQSLWRVPITHFSPWDHNWPFGPPEDARSADGEPKNADEQEEEPTCKTGSVIECQNQVLGESVGITGTPFTLNYSSRRVPGRKASYGVDVPLGGVSVPASLKRIETEVVVAGHRVTRSYSPTAGLSDIFTWDGKDAYGRPLMGAQPAQVTISYVYDGVYRQPAAGSSSFGTPGGVIITGSLARQEVSLSRQHRVMVGSFDNRAQGLGGWTLGIHHAYDANEKTLLRGDGGRRSASRREDAIIETIAGNPQGSPDDGIPATQARLGSSQAAADAIAVAPDGTVYISAGLRIRRIGRDGIIRTVAGSLTATSIGDGGPATEARLNSLGRVAFGVDGSLYIPDHLNHRVRRVAPNGIISTVAGSTQGFGGDGGPATAARMSVPRGVAVAPDNTLYILDEGNYRVRRVGPDGIITTFAGTGQAGFQGAGDGEPATQAPLGWVRDIALGSDGNVYLSDVGSRRVRRISPAGIITTVVGNGEYWGPTEGVPATQTGFRSPQSVAVRSDGTLYISDGYYNAVHRVDPAGIISKAVGVGWYQSTTTAGDGGLARAADMFWPGGIAFGPDGALYVLDDAKRRLRRVTPGLPGLRDGLTAVASVDGSEVYAFDGGRHVRTMNALTGTIKYSFEYNSDQLLVSVTDGDGNVTRVERSAGLPTAIVAPGGQRTSLHLNGDGYLDEMTDPASKSHRFGYGAGGVLTGFTDRNDQPHTMEYDEASGRMTRDANPAGGFWAASRTPLANGWSTTLTSAMGRSSTYRVERPAIGGKRHVNTGPDGLTTTTVFGADGSRTTASPDGTSTTLVLSPDPRWGMQSPLGKSMTLRTPGGLYTSVASTREVSLANPADAFSLQSLTDTFTINGRSYVTTYTAATRTRDTVSPMGRHTVEILDAQGRVIEQRLPGLTPITYQYDAQGHFRAALWGERSLTIDYNERQRPWRLHDSLSRSFRFEYDTADRVRKQLLPDDREISFGYDRSGNVTSLTPPGRPEHAFTYSAVDRPLTYIPPDLGTGADTTSYSDNLDRQRTLTRRPDGKTVQREYDDAGRLSILTTDRGPTTYTYHPTAGNLTRITAPDGSQVEYGYDGSLHTSTTWTGPVAGSVSRTYDNNLRMASESVNGGYTVTYAYDNDGLRIRAGELGVTRSPINGLVTGTTLGGVTDSYEYNGFGEVSRYTARFGSTEIFDAQYRRDAVGRIDQIAETIAGITRVFGYEYDLASRLTVVRRDGVVIASYGYDSNGNRLSAAGERGFFAGTYNARDQMTSYGGASFTYSAAGEMTTATEGTSIASFDFDALGKLRGVGLPDGTAVAYVLDAAGQRIGRRLNGGLGDVRLYGRSLEVVASLDAATGAVSARYVFLDPLGAPAYMSAGGHTYRIISDHLGSARFVVDAGTGEIVQRLAFDEWGNVTLDSNPGFQPFGFSGREQDLQTGLVYMRARWYSPHEGRFISEDPIGLNGGINLYSYVGSSPTTRVDHFGLDWVYSQSTGNLYQQTSAGLTYVATGYAGVGPGYNNPAMEGVGFVGPLPAGTYDIGAPLFPPYTNTGPYSLPLDAGTTAQLLGRDNDMRIHGDNSCNCQNASSGCIIMNRTVREQVWNSNDHVLQVMHADPLPPMSPPMPGPVGRFVNWLTTLFGGR